LLRFPFFDLHRREPAGQRLCVAFFCFRFLAKQEKGVAAGLPPASNRTATTEVQTRPGKSKSKTACRQHAYSMRPPGLCAWRRAWNMRSGRMLMKFDTAPIDEAHCALRLRLTAFLSTSSFYRIVYAQIISYNSNHDTLRASSQGFNR
jgi:hypothetical protein